MDLEDTFEGQLAQDIAHRFAPVPLVGQQIVQVEENGAVAAVRHACDIGTVGKLAWPGQQVVDACLDQEWQGRGRVVSGYVIGSSVHPSPCLRRR